MVVCVGRTISSMCDGGVGGYIIKAVCLIRSQDGKFFNEVMQYN